MRDRTSHHHPLLSPRLLGREGEQEPEVGVENIPPRIAEYVG